MLVKKWQQRSPLLVMKFPILGGIGAARKAHPQVGHVHGELTYLIIKSM
jgi:hypothetical protein